MGDNHSLSEKVFHKLQEDILSGKYAVDEELKEKTIGDELGVSRTPVREALRQLELQGLVTITPNKGAHVTGFSKEDLNVPSGQRKKPLRSRLRNWKKLYT